MLFVNSNVAGPHCLDQEPDAAVEADAEDDELGAGVVGEAAGRDGPVPEDRGGEPPD